VWRWITSRKRHSPLGANSGRPPHCIPVYTTKVSSETTSKRIMMENENKSELLRENFTENKWIDSCYII